MSSYNQGSSMFTVCMLCLVLSASARHYPRELLPQTKDEEYYQPSAPNALQTILKNLEIDDVDTSDLKMTNKRALSILTRWKSLGTVGRRTNAISKSPRAPLSLMHGDIDDGYTKDMPGRRVGGPLRWGRRR